MGKTLPSETTTRDRAQGALVGLAVGDAVGTTLEFEPPGTFQPITDLVGGGPFRLEPGRWTDDTSMAMCLAESILDTAELDPADQLRRYLAWREEGYWSSTEECFDIGNATGRALSRFARHGTVVDATIDQEAAANGSLMRLAPVPIRWHRDLAEAAERSGESSRTTHAARRPVDACRVYGAMLAALIQGARYADVVAPGFWETVDPGGSLTPEVGAVMAGSWRGKDASQVRGSGYVVDALEAAIWAVDGATDFRDAVLRAANLGDDADTTAAIAGQLAGARWGLSGIPADWVAVTHEGERIAAIAGLLHDAATGAAPAHVWPHDDVVHGYWVEPGRILAGEYPGDPGSERMAARKVDLLVDHGIRTFVDLTGPDDRMAPYQRVLDQVSQARGVALERINHRITDMGVVDREGYDEILASIADAATRGGVYIHCWGGIGRTATVVGCLLVDSGLDGEAALARIQELREPTRKGPRRAPQTDEQDDVVLQRSERT